MCAGPLCDGELELDDAGDRGRGEHDHAAQAQPETAIVAAAAAAADLPLGRGLLGVRALELGFPVPEQAGVLLVLVITPEVLERVEVADRGLDRPGGGDLRAVEAMARPHRRGARTARARRGQDLAGLRPGALDLGVAGAAGSAPPSRRASTRVPSGGVSKPTEATGALRKPLPGAAGPGRPGGTCWLGTGAGAPARVHLRPLRAGRAVPAGLTVTGRPVRRLRQAGQLAGGGTPRLRPALRAAHRTLRAAGGTLRAAGRRGVRRGAAPQLLVPRLVVKGLVVTGLGRAGRGSGSS